MIWVYGLLLTVLIPLQGLLADYFSIGNIKPDLVFLAIYFIGLFFGSVQGTVVGGAVGFIADVLSGGLGMPQMASGMLLGMASGAIRKTLLNLRLFFNSLILFVFSLLHSFLIFTFSNVLSKETYIIYPWRDIFLPKGIYDAFLGSFFFWLLMKFFKNKDGFGGISPVERIFDFTARKS